MPPHVPAILGVTFLAAFAQGVTGFGSALVAMPLLSVLLGVGFAAPFVTLLSLATNIALLVPARRRIPWPRVSPLLAGSIVGIPFGLLFLVRADPRLARMGLGVALIAASVLPRGARRVQAGQGGAMAFATGTVAGLLGGAFNLSGPPVITYVASRPWTKEEAHATLQLYFLSTNVIIIVGQALAGVMTMPVVLTAGTALPALAVGAVAGWGVHRRVSEERFRGVVRAALAAAGLALLLAG